MKNKQLKKGTRLKVFDYTLFIDDVTTPLNVTMKPCTIFKLRREANHGRRELIDVIFDRRPKQISYGHFTNSVNERDLIK